MTNPAPTGPAEPGETENVEAAEDAETTTSAPRLPGAQTPHPTTGSRPLRLTRRGKKVAAGAIAILVFGAGFGTGAAVIAAHHHGSAAAHPTIGSPEHPGWDDGWVYRHRTGTPRWGDTGPRAPHGSATSGQAGKAGSGGTPTDRTGDSGAQPTD